MAARFEIAVLGKGNYRVYDEYWDKQTVVKVSEENTPIAAAVRLVDNMIKNGDAHRWFAAGISGHAHIFENPESAYPIPGRYLRYK